MFEVNNLKLGPPEGGGYSSLCRTCDGFEEEFFAQLIAIEVNLNRGEWVSISKSAKIGERE